MASSLTKNERLVLYGLVKWPEAHDVDLSDKLQVKRTTVTAIRNKLESQNYYDTARVPDLLKIGCEIFSVKYGKFNPLTPYDVRKEFFPEDIFGEAFFSITADNHDVVLLAAENFTSFRLFEEYFTTVYGQKKFISPEGHTFIIQPLSRIKFIRHFDFAPLIKSIYGLDVEEEPVDTVDTEYKKITPTKYSANEKIVFHSLVEHPQLRDEEIAEKVGLTRQSVSNIRRKLESNNEMSTLRIPNLSLLGLELISFLHMKYNPKMPLSKRAGNILERLREPNHFLMVTGDLEGIRLSAFREYNEFQETFSRQIGYYKKHGILAQEPHIELFSIQDLKCGLYGRYAPLLAKIFHLKNEYESWKLG